jgi:hypothetical protein
MGDDRNEGLGGQLGDNCPTVKLVGVGQFHRSCFGHQVESQPVRPSAEIIAGGVNELSGDGSAQSM